MVTSMVTLMSLMMHFFASMKPIMFIKAMEEKMMFANKQKNDLRLWTKRTIEFQLASHNFKEYQISPQCKIKVSWFSIDALSGKLRKEDSPSYIFDCFQIRPIE